MPEILVKRARPLPSRLVPVGAPIGFSGEFSITGSKVFSAQSFSDSEGWRLSLTSAIGDSVTGLSGFVDRFFAILTTRIHSDHRRGVVHEQDTETTNWSVRSADCAKAPTSWHISRRRKPRDTCATETLRVRREIQDEKNSCR